MTTQNTRVVVRAPGEGTTVSALGIQMTFKVVSEDTGGKYAFYEYVAPPGFGGPPPHTHPHFDELWYVLEGELTLRVGERSIVAAPGSMAHVPGDTVHSFSNPTAAPVKFLGLLIPGGFERYFDELPALVAQHGYPPPPKLMQELTRKYGIIPAPPQTAEPERR